jgi:hypothetical protein
MVGVYTHESTAPSSLTRPFHDPRPLQVGVYDHEHDEIDRNSDTFLKVYSPSVGDGCYVNPDEDGLSVNPTDSECVDEETVAWWRMSCG